MQHSLDRSDGQSASGCLINPVGSFPGHIYRRKRCVIAEREPVGVGRLPMLKPRVLFLRPGKGCEKFLIAFISGAADSATGSQSGNQERTEQREQR